MKILFLITLVVYIYYINQISFQNLHMLQQNRYNRGRRYSKWIRTHFQELFGNTSLLYVIFLLFSWNQEWNKFAPIIFLFMLGYLQVVQIAKRKKEVTKIPLKKTARIKRLILTNNIVHIIICLALWMSYHPELLSVDYLLLGWLASVNPFVILIVNFLNKPIEQLINIYFKKKAIQKLETMSETEVIAITGSYGKTSTKNIVYEILSCKFNVFKTPENYNTPYGLMITINQYLDKYNDYFIAEMGACKKGEIKELCDFVKPKYGILTTIGLAHLETFGSEKNIEDTKFELIESLPKDGMAILNADDEKQLHHHLQNQTNLYWIGIKNKNADCYAKNIKLTKNGTTFEVFLKKEKKSYPFQTQLLGANNIYNLLAGILLGYQLGISIEELQKAVLRIKPVEHRLSLSKYYDIMLIDDAYNSNPKGAKCALEVLKMMPGHHIVITPGMIEMGLQEEKANYEFGQYMASCTDEVILIGKEKTKPIYEGLLQQKFPKENIYILNNVMEAFPLARKLKKKETYVLIENDLPDTFNEK